MKRRTALQLLAKIGLGTSIVPYFYQNNIEKMSTRKIPFSGEALPMVGLGTWQTFDVGNDATMRQQLAEVLMLLVENGGAVVDSSPMYGTSESVVGDLSKQAGLQNGLFLATKVWTRGREAGIREMERSMQRMKTNKMELMQIHNLLDWQVHVKTLRDWKAAGKIKYWGITHYTSGAYDSMIRVINQERPDFVQINFSLAEHSSMDRLIPTAANQGAAVIINRPYGGGSLFRRVKGKPMPDWASEMDAHSWGQIFLKYILSYKEITCVIPGTSKPKHIADNAMAGFGKLPDEQLRKKIRALF